MTVIYSSDQGLINQELIKILDNDYYSYQKITYKSIEQIAGILHSTNLFEDADKKIIISGCTFLSNQNETNVSDDLFAILNLNLASKVYLTVEAERLSKSKALNDLIAKLQVIFLPKLNNYSMQKAISTTLLKANIDLQYESLSLFISRMIPNALIIQNEVKKLSLFPKEELNQELLNNLIFEYDNESVFKILELVSMNKTLSVAKLYDALVPDRYTPLEILQIISGQLVKLLLVYWALNESIDENEITKNLKITLFQFKSMRRICGFVSMKTLESFLNAIMLLNNKIKQNSVDEFNSVRFLLLRGIFH